MPMSGIFAGLNISASGLRAQRVRQNLIASNLANAETTRTDKGEPYRRQYAVLEADPKEFENKLNLAKNRLLGNNTDERHMYIPQVNGMNDPEYVGSGVKVAAIVDDQTPFKTVYDPAHPDADEKGYVHMPNISVVQEMTDMITATRAYEANTSAFNATKSMLQKALEL